MIAPLPLDPGLPQLGQVFDPDVLRQVTSDALGTGIASVQPTYLRYKPGTSALLLLDLGLLLEPGGEPVVLPASLRLACHDRGQRRTAHPRLVEAAARLAGRNDAPPCRPMDWAESIGGLFQIYPLDHDLRFLLRATDPAEMTRQIRSRAPGFEHAEVAGTPVLVRYKPARRAVLRYTLADGPHTHLYGKVHRHMDMDQHRAQTAAIARAGIVTPEIVITHPRRPFVAHAAGAGTPLANMRGRREYLDAMAEVVELVKMVQSSEAPGRNWAPEAELQAAGKSLDLLSVVLPHLAPRLSAINRALASRLSMVTPTSVPAHGDFYDDQLLVSEVGLVLLDLDEMRLAHPLVDVGNLLAHLLLAQADGDDVAAAIDILRETATASWPGEARHLDTFMALGLTRLSVRPLRTLQPDWPERVEHSLDRIETLLQEGPIRRGQARNEAGICVTDPHLPQLRTLLDQTAVSQRLAAETGADLTVDTVDLVRHKPGRRAILRYRVSTASDRETTFYAKTFASGRGPRVHAITEQIVQARAFGTEVALPEPVAYLDDLKCIVQRMTPGAPVTSRLLGDDPDVAVRIAEALHRFHTSGLDLGRHHDLAKELSPLPERVEQVRQMDAAIGERAGVCLDRLLARAAGGWSWRNLPVHRDFYHEQVLIDGDGLAVLDLDDAAMSEPAVDIANFIAHLMLLGPQLGGSVHLLQPTIDIFFARSFDLDRQLDPDLVTFLTGTTLLRLAGIHVTRRRGMDVAPALVTAAEATLSLERHAERL